MTTSYFSFVWFLGCRTKVLPYIRNMSFNQQKIHSKRETIFQQFQAGTLPFQLQPVSCALFLDIDGTLLDIALSPDSVQVPDGLSQILDTLSQQLDGALALVTGRRIDFVDTLFPAHRFAVAGLHGAERRNHSGAIERIEPDTNFIKAKTYLCAISEKLPGVIFEDKNAAVALHFRNVPAMQNEVEHCMVFAAGVAGSGWVIQRGKMVVELRPVGNDKGAALQQFMSESVFRGRTPLAFGDDLTDESMFRAATNLGGFAIRIGDNLEQSCANALLPTPSDLRNWLGKLTVTKRKL